MNRKEKALAIYIVLLIIVMAVYMVSLAVSLYDAPARIVYNHTQNFTLSIPAKI